MKQISEELLKKISYYLLSQDSSKDSSEIYHEIKEILTEDMAGLNHKINEVYKYLDSVHDELRDFKIEFSIYKEKLKECWRDNV